MLELIKMMKFNPEQIVAFGFITFMLYQKFNIAYYIKRLFKLKLTKRYKLLDCYPCSSFWFTLAITLNVYTAITVYLFAVLIDRK